MAGKVEVVVKALLIENIAVRAGIPAVSHARDADVASCSRIRLYDV